MTTEYIAQMLPMLAIAGAMVGWMAQIGPTTRGYGLLPDMALGLAGSVFAATLVRTAISADAGMLAMFVIGGVGATLAVVAQRGLWHPAPVVTNL